MGGKKSNKHKQEVGSIKGSTILTIILLFIALLGIMQIFYGIYYPEYFISDKTKSDGSCYPPIIHCENVTDAITGSISEECVVFDAPGEPYLKKKAPLLHYAIKYQNIISGLIILYILLHLYKRYGGLIHGR